ncbi:hypothetical protein RIF29_19114 [Crotalaria pallida]|uniref:SANT domain-containing protein n=1 Tax=Crotalaria pallida TaxID=3830 RepID=A0AAN9I7G4_CROPI
MLQSETSYSISESLLDSQLYTFGIQRQCCCECAIMEKENKGDDEDGAPVAPNKWVSPSSPVSHIPKLQSEGPITMDLSDDITADDITATKLSFVENSSPITLDLSDSFSDITATNLSFEKLSLENSGENILDFAGAATGIEGRKRRRLDCVINLDSWTDIEHRLFLRGMANYKGNWKVISEDFVKTKTKRQVEQYAGIYHLRNYMRFVD